MDTCRSTNTHIHTHTHTWKYVLFAILDVLLVLTYMSVCMYDCVCAKPHTHTLPVRLFDWSNHTQLWPHRYSTCLSYTARPSRRNSLQLELCVSTLQLSSIEFSNIIFSSDYFLCLPATATLAVKRQQFHTHTHTHTHMHVSICI